MQKDRPAKRHKSAHNPSTTNSISDPRFASLETDPRYRLPSKRDTHVRLDKRFKHMLHDDEFYGTAKVDRYGRKLPKADGRKQLERFYEFEEDDDDYEDDSEVQAELARLSGGDRDFMREGLPSDQEDSSSEEDEDEDGDEEAGEGAEFPDQPNGTIPIGEVTERIAVVNLDWDNIRAADLMAVFSSFTISGGKLRHVAVYPSEFGRERMEKEEMEGPPVEIFASKSRQDVVESDSDEDDEDIKKSILKEDQGEEFEPSKLRHYQIERLRYYYAVLTFSSPDVAKSVYDAVDGTEYLSSANFFDLRFIPDDTDFSDDKPRDECSKIPAGYKPTEFVTSALMHSKVKLTWDAEDNARKEAQAKAFRGSRRDIDENDLKAYLASDSEESFEEDEVVDDPSGKKSGLGKKEAERQRMRSLLGLPAEEASRLKSKASGPVGDMQITFTSGLSSGDPKPSVFENEPEREENTVEKYVRKEKERRQRRRERMRAAKKMIDVEDTKNSEAAEAPQEDLGFDDPFFSTPADESQETAKAKRKEDKRKKREQREAKEAEDAAEKEKLELLMAADDHDTDIKHFDMHEIQKAEKARRKGKKRKGKMQEVEKAAQEGFDMDVNDERFRGLFEDSNFAIDPTNPRFKGTEGMKKLLDEGRKRRTNQTQTDESKSDMKAGKKRIGSKGMRSDGTDKKDKSKSNPGDDDWKKLVEKFKGKNKTAF